MADLVVFVGSVTANSVGVYVSCWALTSDMIDGDSGVNFITTIGWNKTQAKANAQIQDEAIAAVLAQRGTVIGVNDNKILIAGVGGW